MKRGEEPAGDCTAPGEVRLQRLLPGTAERVWAYLTDGALRAQWLAGGPMEPRAGGRAILRFRHADLSGEKTAPAKYGEYENGHVVEGTILRWDPPRALSYTWGDGQEDSEVAFELEPRDGGVLLTVTHRRLRSRDGMASVAAGWHAHLGILLDRFAGREPRGFWSAHAELEAGYARRFAAAEAAPAGARPGEGRRGADGGRGKNGMEETDT